MHANAGSRVLRLRRKMRSRLTALEKEVANGQRRFKVPILRGSTYRNLQ